MKKKHFVILTVLAVVLWCAYMGYLITYSEEISTPSVTAGSSVQTGENLHISKVSPNGTPLENSMTVTFRYSQKEIINRGVYMLLGLGLCIVMFWCCYKYFRQPFSLRPLAVFTLYSALCLPTCLALFGWIAFRNMAIQCLAFVAVFYTSAYLYGRLQPGAVN